MLALSRIPKPPLSDFIGMLWYYEGYAATHAKERILPTGTVEIIINLAEDVTRLYDKRDTKQCITYSGIALSGVLTEYAVIDTDEQMHVMGINFKPGGAFPFFNMPLSELQDVHASLEDIWGKDAPDIRNRLLALHDPSAKFDLLEAVLMERMRCYEHHRAVRFALHEISDRHSQPIAKLVEKIGLSSRRFIQLFADQVGLTPKVFCRIQRFQNVIRELRGEGEADLADVALHCGYFDQPHFVHDFKAFSGLSPTEYLARRSVHLNHVPLED